MEHPATAECIGDEWHVTIPGVGSFTTIWLRHLEIEARMMIADHHGIELHEASVKVTYGRSAPRDWTDPDGLGFILCATRNGNKANTFYVPRIRVTEEPE